MLWFSITLSAKEATQPRPAQILRKILAKTPRSRRNEQSIPPIMKNERPKTQQNLLKRERYRPEHSQLHQIPNWGRATRTGIQLPKWETSPRQPNQPAAAIPQGGRVRVQRIGKGGMSRHTWFTNRVSTWFTSGMVKICLFEKRSNEPIGEDHP